MLGNLFDSRKGGPMQVVNGCIMAHFAKTGVLHSRISNNKGKKKRTVLGCSTKGELMKLLGVSVPTQFAATDPVSS